MASVPENNILTLASRHGLEEGKYADYYNLHGKWCLTKHGAWKIRKAEGITYTKKEFLSDGNLPVVGFHILFTDKNGNTIEEVGGCRYDGNQNTPQRSHPIEMAWKRALVRGTIAILGQDGLGIYGDEEFDADFGQQQNQKQSNPTTQTLQDEFAHARPQQNAPQPTATPPQSNVATNPDGTIDWSKDPRYANAQKAEKWFETALNLPSEWNDLMAKFSEITSEARGKWEKIIFDHSGKFKFSDGGWWQVSRTYKDFPSYVFAVKDGVSKCGGALGLKQKAEEAIKELDRHGEYVFQVPQNNELVAYKVSTKIFKEAEQMLQPTPQVVSETADSINNGGDVPF